MDNILKTADLMQKNAWKVVEDTGIVDIWSQLGATINLVGSLKMGLLINNRDIDFHIYTDPFKLSESFSAISKLGENNRIKSINYSNLLESEDRCLEWHAFYEDKDKELWQIDMIHIRKDSPYAGHFEKVADRITKVLTPETRETILRIKSEIPKQQKVMGIEIYRAVIEHGVTDTDSFIQLKEATPDEGIITWIP